MTLFGGHATVDQRQFHIFLGGEAGNQIKALENKTDLFIADIREFIIGHTCHIDAIQIIIPGSGGIQTAQHIHESGLAGAGMSDDCHKFAMVNGDTDAIQCPDFIFTGIIDLVDIFYFDQMIGHSFISVSLLLYSIAGTGKIQANILLTIFSYRKGGRRMRTVCKYCEFIF